MNEAPQAKCMGTHCTRWSLFPAEGNRYFSPVISRRDQDPIRNTILPSRAGRGARSGLEPHLSEGSMVSETTWVGSSSYTRAGSHPRASQGAGGSLRRREGAFPGALLEESPLLERLSCTGHQEDHKTVYFPTSDKKRWMQGAEKTQPLPC